MMDNPVPKFILFTARQPSWLIRWTIYIFASLVILPFAIVLLLAAIIAGLMFMVFMLISTITRKVREIFPKQTGRENVRVIQR